MDETRLGKTLTRVIDTTAGGVVRVIPYIQSIVCVTHIKRYCMPCANEYMV